MTISSAQHDMTSTGGMHRPTSLRLNATNTSWLRYQRNRKLRSTDHSVHFLAATCLITDDGVVDFGLEERPLTPSFDVGTTTYSSDDDAHS
ncbi:hypothetical protein Scep_023836 [Stephania cephalantha]|uniref:Uncharacterized protein n=1 Tax=Stephania cephalantha TaxID=152367 RepID=A0AAP0EWH9_9MAGN